MAKTKDEINCLQKRDLFNRKAVDPKELVVWAERFLDQGNLMDAVEFFHKAGETERLLLLARQAKEEGDAFIFGRVYQLLGLKPQPEDWRELAEKARAMEKILYREKALEKAGVREAVHE